MGQDHTFVAFGELLLRLQTHRHERFVQAKEFEAYYTGAEANVAVSLANYGVNSFVVSKVPATQIGQACVNFIRGFGVNTDYIARGGSRLGLFYSESGASQRPSRIIYDRAGSAFSQLHTGEIDWPQALASKDWFHFSGTAPAIAATVAEVTKEACIHARECGLTVSCDLNYRSKLWTPEEANRIMTGLMEYVDVLICNEEDAEVVFGIRAAGSDVQKGRLDTEAYQGVAATLAQRFGFKYVAITMRESLGATMNRWSGLLYHDQQCHISRRYEMHVVDRVGGGDSFAGGLIYALLAKLGDQASVEFAAAASCLKHTIHGDFNLVSSEEVAALVGGQESGRVQR